MYWNSIFAKFQQVANNNHLIFKGFFYYKVVFNLNYQNNLFR